MMTFREYVEARQMGYLKGGIAAAAMSGASLFSVHGRQAADTPPTQAVVTQTPMPTTLPTSRPMSQPTTAPTTRPMTQQSAPDIGSVYIGRYIAKNEGKSYKIYDDGIGKPTVGIGHYITPKSHAVFVRLFGPEGKKILAGQEMTEQQVQKLFDYDLDRHMVRARRMIPNIDNYPIYVKAALVDSFYRGDMGRKTAGLINAGRWQDAANEYLNHKQYHNREKLGIPGIGPRMERNAQNMIRYANELDRDTMR